MDMIQIVYGPLGIHGTGQPAAILAVGLIALALVYAFRMRFAVTGEGQEALARPRAGQASRRPGVAYSPKSTRPASGYLYQEVCGIAFGSIAMRSRFFGSLGPLDL